MKKPKGVMGPKHPQGPERDPDGPTELRDKESSDPRDISQRADDTRNVAGTVTYGQGDLAEPGSAVTPESSQCSSRAEPPRASSAGRRRAPGSGLPHAWGTPNYTAGAGAGAGEVLTGAWGGKQRAS